MNNSKHFESHSNGFDEDFSNQRKAPRRERDDRKRDDQHGRKNQRREQNRRNRSED